MRIRLWFALIFNFSLTSCFAQNDTRGWIVYFHNQAISEKLMFRGDVQLRSSSSFAHVNNLLLRASLNYRFSKKHELGLGYLFAQEWLENAGRIEYTPEHRIFQQYLLNTKFTRKEFGFRQRIEERFVDPGKDSEFTGRARSWASLRFPLTKGEKFEKGIYGVLINEVFVNVINVNLTNGAFDQNRLQSGFGYRFSKKLDADMTYMLRTLNTSSGTENSHIIILSVTAKI